MCRLTEARPRRVGVETLYTNLQEIVVELRHRAAETPHLFRALLRKNAVDFARTVDSKMKLCELVKSLGEGFLRWARWIIELGKGARRFRVYRIGHLGPTGLQASPQPIDMSKDVMDTSLERIHVKISELETKIANLRIAERELEALDKVSARQTRTASKPTAKQKPGPKATLRPKLRGKAEASEPAEARQTVGAAISEVLGQHGALSAAEIAEHIKATGQDVSNRAVSFALQSLKKRGLVKNKDGKWTPSKAGSRRARPPSEVGAPEIEAAA